MTLDGWREFTMFMGEYIWKDDLDQYLRDYWNKMNYSSDFKMDNMHITWTETISMSELNKSISHIITDA